MIIIDGRKLANKKTVELTNKVNSMSVKPIFKVLQVGDNKASTKYVDFKLKKATQIGVEGYKIQLDENVSQQKIEEVIRSELDSCDGMIIQLPLPKQLDTQKILNMIPFNKDIDGLATGNNKITPATPRGIISLLDEYKIAVTNKIVAVVGQSNLVGKPVADLIEKRNPKKLMRFIKETGIKGTEQADVLIVAAGDPHLIKKENIKPGVAIIDVGTSIFTNGKIIGDVDRESVGKMPSAMSPVVGGVGPMTVISLFENLVYKKY